MALLMASSTRSVSSAIPWLAVTFKDKIGIGTIERDDDAWKSPSHC